MLRTVLSSLLWILLVSIAHSQIKVGDNSLMVDSASLIEIESTSKGFLPSRMTSAQRDLQTAWKRGHIIYNLTNNCLEIYDGTQWQCLVMGELVDSTIYRYDGALTSDRELDLATHDLTFSGTDVNVTFESTGELGIGIAAPDAPLHIREAMGTPASATDGTLILEHADPGGASSLVFKSGEDPLSDYGYIEYRDDGSGNGTGDQNGLLVIGVENDTALNVAQDDIALMPSGSVGIGTTAPARKLDVDGGVVRFSDYGSGTVSGIPTYLLAVEADGDIIEIDASSVGQNIYNTSDTLTSTRQVILDGNDLTFDGPGGDDVVIQGDGDLVLGAQLLDESGSAGTPGQVLSTTATGTDWVDATVDTDDQIVDQFDLLGSTLRLSLEDDGVVPETVDLSSLDTDDQRIDSFALVGSTLQISLQDDGESLREVDLTPILGNSDNIYNTDGSLDSIRTLTLNSHSLTFDGSSDDLVIHPDGDISFGTSTPLGDLNVVSNENQDAFTFRQTNVLTGERDVFTIEDEDDGGGSQDHSSVLKVQKSGDINSGDNGFSLVELTSTGADPGANKYWISGRKTDEGAPTWGVDITDNDFWSTGGIVLGTGSLGDGTYSGGNFVVESDGDVGVGNVAPTQRLDVSGGDVRFRNYGTGTLNDTSVNYIVTADADGNLKELNTAKNTRWFYAPAVTIDASELVTNATIDIHQEYIDQFTNIPASQRSSGAPVNLPTYAEDELHYVVTAFDNSVITNISVSDTGVLEYDIIKVPFDNYTIVNVIILIK